MRQVFEQELIKFNDGQPMDGVETFLIKAKTMLNEHPMFSHMEKSPLNLYYLCGIINYNYIKGQKQEFRALKSEIGHLHLCRVKTIYDSFYKITLAKIKSLFKIRAFSNFFLAFVNNAPVPEQELFVKESWNEAMQYLIELAESEVNKLHD